MGLGDATKNYRKAERGIKELSFRQDEDRKNAEKMQELIDKLQNQVRTYKKQIEEAVEDIHEVVHVKDTLAVPIVDVADPLNFFNVERHDDFVFFKKLSDSYTVS